MREMLEVASVLAPIVLALGVVLLAHEVAERERRLREMSEFNASLLRALPRNPHAKLLGEVVQAKVRGRDEWEPMLVVAVSHKGALAVRPVSNPKRSARWIHKQHVSERVRSACRSES